MAFRLPRHTVRLRLTFLYGTLFLASGVVLLAMTYFLVERNFPVVNQTFTKLGQERISGALKSGHRTRISPSEAATLVSQLRSTDLHQLFADSGIALAVMAAVSITLGWLVAGRVLRPLRAMTISARQISEVNLHMRLDLRGPHDELKDLSDTIDGLLARLEESFNAQRRFVANASHELRTPLAMMRTSLDVATGKPKPAPQEVTVLAERLREGLDQAEGLLESFLVLAQVQQGSGLEQTSVSIQELALRAVEYQSAAILLGELDVHQSGDVAIVRGSPSLLARMVENVIDNAVQHNERGGYVRIVTMIKSNSVRLTVTSGGTVLDEARVKKLGQPFQRLGTNRTATRGGHGLGISIVSAIVTAHRGTLELSAPSDGGMKVVIELPVATSSIPTGVNI
jgi:hypothetical protein